MKTRNFRSVDGDTEEPSQTPDFDFRAIHRWLKKLERWDACWQSFFDANRIAPLVVVYEDDLEHGYQEAGLRILEYLKIPVPQDLTFHASRRKQSDELSEAFVRLYQEKWRRRSGLAN